MLFLCLYSCTASADVLWLIITLYVNADYIMYTVLWKFFSYRCNVKSSPRVPVKWMLPLLLQHLQFLWQPVNGKEVSVREPIDMSLFLVHPAGWTKKTDSIPPSTNSLHFHLLAAEHDRLAKHTVTWATWTLFHDSQEFWAILSSWGGHSRSEITGSDGKHHPLSLLPHLSPFLFLIFYTLPPCCFSFSLGSRTVLFSLFFMWLWGLYYYYQGLGFSFVYSIHPMVMFIMLTMSCDLLFPSAVLIVFSELYKNTNKIRLN